MAKTRLNVAQCLESEILTSKQLQASTGLSQPGVARQLRVLGERVVKLPHGRNPKYALTRNAFGLGDKYPLIAVDSSGTIAVTAYIRPLLIRGFFVELLPEGSTLLLGVQESGVFDDLPYYLQDLRPQGFVGRQIAKDLATRSNEFPSDPSRWRANHIARYLLNNGEDLPGNLQFGEAAQSRTRRTPIAYSRDSYSEIADSVLAGEIAGTSAGGEQPKFTVYSKDRAAHVLVKFSPKGDHALARRWRDVLITEYHAAKTLLDDSIPAAEVELIESDNRLFLEAKRFDRVGQFGRRSMISLQMVDAEFVGDGAEWPVVMRRLADSNLTSSQHYHYSCLLWEFGYLINNTDMHLGNLSLSMTGNLFSILPIYDMCSMGFAPVHGELRSFSLSSRLEHSRLNCLDGNTSAQQRVQALAIDFWERVAKDERISEEFRKFLSNGNPAKCGQ